MRLFLIIFILFAGVEYRAAEPAGQPKRPAHSGWTCALFGPGAAEVVPMRVDFEYRCDSYQEFFNLWTTDFVNLDHADAARNFQWSKVDAEMEVEQRVLAVRNKKRIIRYVYHKKGDPDWIYGFVLARETSPDWCRPFLIAGTEDATGLRMFEMTLLSTDERPLAITVTLLQSGTGAHRSHCLIDLSAGQPRVLATAFGHRIRDQDFQSLQKFREYRDHMMAEERRATGR